MNEAEIRRLTYQQELKGGRGLKVKKNKDGSASFILQKHMKGRKNALRLKIGLWPDMSIDQAEEKAIQYRRLIDDGTDPRDYETKLLKDRKQEKLEEERKAITLKELHRDYMQSRLALSKHSPASIKSYQNTMQSVWADFWHDPIQEITGERLWDYYQYWVSQRASKKTGKPALQQIKKGVRYLRAELNYAIYQKKYLTENACNVFRHQISMQADTANHYLQPRESKKFFECLTMLVTKTPSDKASLQNNHQLTEKDFHPSATVVLDVVALEFLSGLRQEEVRTLQWKKVYLEREDYEEEGATGPFFEVITNKQKNQVGIPITNKMLGLFQRRLKEKTNQYVFPSPIHPDQCVSEDRRAYKILKKILDVQSLRKTETLSSKVLRHTFATAGFTVTKNMETVDMITGHYTKHRRGVATPVYVHLQADEHRSIFEDINNYLTGDIPTPDWVCEWSDFGNSNIKTV